MTQTCRVILHANTIKMLNPVISCAKSHTKRLHSTHNFHQIYQEHDVYQSVCHPWGSCCNFFSNDCVAAQLDEVVKGGTKTTNFHPYLFLFHQGAIKSVTDLADDALNLLTKAVHVKEEKKGGLCLPNPIPQCLAEFTFALTTLSVKAWSKTLRRRFSTQNPS